MTRLQIERWTCTGDKVPLCLVAEAVGNTIFNLIFSFSVLYARPWSQWMHSQLAEAAACALLGNPGRTCCAYMASISDASTEPDTSSKTRTSWNRSSNSDSNSVLKYALLQPADRQVRHGNFPLGGLGAGGDRKLWNVSNLRVLKTFNWNEDAKSRRTVESPPCPELQPRSVHGSVPCLQPDAEQSSSSSRTLRNSPKRQFLDAGIRWATSQRHCYSIVHHY